MEPYVTLLPRMFILDDGELVELKPKDVLSMKGGEFLAYFPNVRSVYERLRREGFKDVRLVKRKGERFDLTKKLRKPWELHIRIYDDGFAECEVEVEREYVEHLGKGRVFVIYEIYDYIKEEKMIFYRPKERWITEILENYVVRLDPPKTLTPWKPILLSIAGIIIARRIRSL